MWHDVTKPCQFCKAPSTHLCDFILGWNRNRMMHTCDAPMCDDCRTQTGIITLGGVDSIDCCPRHVGKHDVPVTPAPNMTAREAEAIRRRNQFTVTP